MRRVLWITNCEPAFVANIFNRSSVSGQWIDYSGRLLSKRPQIELSILSMGYHYEETIADDIHCYGFEMKDAKSRIEAIIQRIKPDIIHIWGTEFEHFLLTMEIISRANMLDNTVISIQGLVSEIASYTWFMLPQKIINKKTLYEWYVHNSIVDAKEYYSSRGVLERKGLMIARHCIGRTDWDKAVTRQYNNAIHYHRCNEILRRSFYDNRWKLEECEKHCIVFSQSGFMIKGFHILVEAFAIIKEFYPDSKIYAVGNSPFNYNLEKWIKRSTYLEYIKSLIDNYGLRDDIGFVGTLEEAAMVKHYLRGNVFVSASAIENSSNSIGEAMLLGMPVVASDVGGVKTFINHCQNGLLYQANSVRMLADCIMRIFEDDAFALEIAENAYLSASVIYDYNKNTSDLCEIYEEMLNDDVLQGKLIERDR